MEFAPLPKWSCPRPFRPLKEYVAPAGNEVVMLGTASNDPLEATPRYTVTGYVALDPLVTGLGVCTPTITAPTFPFWLIARLAAFEVTEPHALLTTTSYDPALLVVTDAIV